MASAGHFLNIDFRADSDRTASGFVSLFDAGTADDIAACREIRSFDIFIHQFDDRDVRIFHYRNDRVDRFTEVMRCHICCHTDSNTHRTVYEQVREFRRQDYRFFKTGIVVIFPVDGFLTDILDHLHGDLRHSGFGVTVSSCFITIDGTKVTMTVYQRISVGEVLSHTDHRIVSGGITMRMILA